MVKTGGVARGSVPGVGSARDRLPRDRLGAAAGRTVPDLVAPGLRVLFVGINPSLWSAAVSAHFARPGNRFWAALHGAGFTDRRLGPSDGEALLAAGLGITNLVARATGGAHEVTAAELRAGRERLTRLVEGVQPRAVAVLGLSAYRTAFGCPHATVGRRPEPLGGEAVWPLPNPSGRAAGYQLPALVSAYAALRASLDADVAG